MAEDSDGQSVLKPRKLWIESTPFTPEGYADQSSVLVESSPPRVKLTHFSTKPVIDFGNVRTGKTVTRKLVVENPNLYEVDVKVEKFPWKKNFKIDQESFTVDEEELYYLEITWSPSQSGNCRELVMMKYDNGFRVHVLIVGHADSPKKVRTRVRRGHTSRRTIKKDLNKSSATANQNQAFGINNSENIDPVSLSTTGFDQDSKILISQSINKSTDIFAEESTRSILGEKHDFNNLRNALLPFHVVNNSQRDSCGSITAPTSPSGLDVPVIREVKASPLSVTHIDSTEQNLCLGQHSTNFANSLPEPNRVTFCIDPNVSKLPSHQSPFKSQIVTGRPTYVLPTDINSESQAFGNIAKPTLPDLRKKQNGDTPLTPRSHRRSRTFVKKEMPHQAPIQNFSNEKIDMVDYALSMLAPTPVVSNSEKVFLNESVSPEDSLEGSKMQVNAPAVTIEPPSTIVFGDVHESDEVAERLSSTRTHDRTSLGATGGLPVPDISVITSHSPLKIRKRKSPEPSSPVEQQPIQAKRITPSQNESSKTSRRRINSGAYGTPKGRALQRRRAAKANETMPIPKPAGIATKKKFGGRLSLSIKPDQASAKSPGQTASKRVSSGTAVNDKQKSIKRRKVKMPITRLVLKSQKAASNESPVRVRMLYSSSNMYYDERWRQKQEHAYTTWLNYILTPDEFKPILEAKNANSSNKTSSKTLNHSDVFGQKSEKSSLAQPALTKETASLRAYGIQKRLNQLRKAACNLFESPSFVTVARKVEEAVESSRIKLREDKRMWADIGNRNIVLELILSFHPLWLRVCLEVLFNRMLFNYSYSDSYGLSNFISRNLLNCREIEYEFAHPTVPHSFKPGYNEKISKHTLKKFLILIYFLEQAKQNRLIDHDPCLFRKESKFRNCKDILQSFSRDLLRGEGDIIRHLSCMGYKVTYNQTFIDEFEFGIKNIAVDLRDGVRLVRIVELLFHQHNLTTKLRVPAGSLFQKKHNVEIALKALESHGVDMCDSWDKKIEVDHIVKGHCEMTLALLWNIASYFQLEKAVDQKLLKGEIEYLKKSLRLKHMMEKTRNFYEEQDTANSVKSKTAGSALLLLEWCRLVCAFKSVPVHNFCASFSDGRVLACLISYYQSNLIKPSQIYMKTTLSQRDPDPNLDDSVCVVEESVADEEISQARLLKNEKINLKLVQNAAYEMGGIPNLLRIDDICNTIPDDKVVKLLVSFLCNRLLDIGVEDKAARTIQIAWKAYKYRKTIFDQMRTAIEEERRRNHAAVIIAAAYRSYKTRIMFLCLKSAVTSIQKLWRAKIASRPYRLEFLKLRSAVILLQSIYRGIKARKFVESLRKERKLQQASAYKLQYYWRGRLVRKRFLSQKIATLKIQKWFRDWKAAKAQRHEFLAYKSAVAKIQCRWRLTLEMRKQVAIFSTKKEAAVSIQRAFRAYIAMKQRKAAICIQRKWRATIQMRKDVKDFKAMKIAAIVIQRAVKSFIAKKKLSRMRKERNAIVFIQKKLRAELEMRSERNEFLRIKSAVIIIQCAWRCVVANRAFSRLLKRQNAAKIIQERWRGYTLMKNERDCFLKKKKAVVTLQYFWKCALAKRELEYLRRKLRAIVTIQRKWKATMLMKNERSEFEKVKKASVTLQCVWRCFTARKELANLQKRQHAAIFIQTWWRATLIAKNARSRFLSKKNAIIVIQNAWRCFLAKRMLSEMREKHKAASIIQSSWKRFLQMKNDIKDFNEKKSAVLTIQCAWRQLVARIELSRLRKRRDAALIIQRKYRATLLMRDARLQFRTKKDSTIKIQCAYRCYIAKKALLELRKQKCAVIIIQRKWKATLLLKKHREQFVRQRTACVTIQCAIRTTLARRKLENLRRTRNAVCVIQERWRCTLQARRKREAFLQSKNSAMTIQCAWRCYMARCQLAILKNRQNAAIVIQRRWWEFIMMKSEKKQFTDIKRATVCIQCAWRGFIARQKLAEMRKRHAAIMLIQARWRATLLMRQNRESFLTLKICAVKIQCFWRCVLAKRTLEVLQTRQRAAIFLQQKWRALLLMTKVREQFLRMRSAIVVIQCFWRCVAAKRALAELCNRRNAAVVIQTKWKATLLMRKEVVQFSVKKNATVTIQQAWRCYSAKKQLTELRKKRDAVIKIQNRWRATQIMKTVKKEFINKKKAAIIIQCAWRCFTAKKKLMQLRELNQAAILIQEKWRATQLMKVEKEKYQKQRSSSLVLQCFWRRILAQRQLCVLRTMHNAILVIQNRWRATLSMTAENARFLKKKNAALIIQYAYRCTLARTKLELLRRRRDAAYKIQKWWKAIQKMKTTRNEFLRLKNSVVTIQCIWRCYVARQNLCDLRKRVAAVCIIQYKWKATLQMRAQRDEFSKVKMATISIQSSFRGLVARRTLSKLKKERNAAVVIQTRWRATLMMRSIRTSFLMQKKSAMIIQCFLRSISAKNKVKHMKKTLTASITIQRWWEATQNMRKQRHEYLCLKNSVVTIQCAWRCFIARRLLQDQLNAICIIQQKWRATLLSRQLREKFLQMKNSAVVIQCFWRCCSAKMKVSILRERYHATLTIQRKWKATISMKSDRNLFFHKKNSAIIIQQAFRCFIAKRKLAIMRKKHKAALVIQRHWRATILMKKSRSEFLLLRQSALTIQRAWRCALARQEASQLRKKLACIRSIQVKWRETLLMRRDRKNFLNTKKAVVTVQRAWRCYQKRKAAMIIKKQKKSAALIQTYWRSFLFTKKIRNEFLAKRKASIIIQNAWKIFVAKGKLCILRQKVMAARVIQTRWRATQLIKKERTEYLGKIKAIYILQRGFRCLLAKGMLSKMKDRRNAALVIQEKWRAVLCSRRAREMFLEKKKAAVSIQCAVRCFLAKLKTEKMRERRNAAVIIQRRWRSALLLLKDRKKFLNIKDAVMLIQRVRRGYLVRRTIDDRKILRARRKCATAYKHARQHPGRKICNRMNSALSLLLDAKAYDAVFATLEDIYSLSLLLPYCCERISEEGGTEVLCQLIISCNRSIHAAFVQKFSINILLNLIKNPSTRENTCKILASTDQKSGTSPIELLVSVLSRFRDRGGRDCSHVVVFCATCTLLIEFCRDKKNVEIFKSITRSVDMVRYINRETKNRMRTKMNRNMEVQLKKQRESVSYLTLSSSMSENNTLNESNLLDVTTRETSFLCNMDTKRVSTPKYKQQKKDLENKDPSTKQKQPIRNLTAKKVVSNLFGEGAVPPKVKQSIVPIRSSWHTNIPIHKSKKVTKPQSPKFTGARSKKMAVLPENKIDLGTTARVSASTRHSSDSSKFHDLAAISHNELDPLSCINTLCEMLV